ncbi:MAG: hypothetical protein M1834_006918 [Cirrosporium novae-zelandiae]|nr:MAG: hypothetical protein M1834_006918 [Cirrosporium novae-zelandiae]
MHRFRFTNRTGVKAETVGARTWLWSGNYGNVDGIEWKDTVVNNDYQTGWFAVPSGFHRMAVYIRLDFPGLNPLVICLSTVYHAPKNGGSTSAEAYIALNQSQEDPLQQDNWPYKYLISISKEYPSDEVHLSISWNPAFQDPASSGMVTHVTIPCPLFPVYQTLNGRTQCTFTPKDLVLQSEDSVSTESSPVVAVAADDLRVIVHFSDARAGGAPLMLQGFLEVGNEIDTEPCTEDLHFKLYCNRLDHEIKIKKFKSYLPWGLKGKIHWRVTVIATKKCLHKGVVPLEMYYLSPHLPQYLRQGIPASLLRMFLLPLRKDKIEDHQNTWTAYATKKIHDQPNVHYNSFHGGAPSYTLAGCWFDDVGESRRNAVTPVMLDQWVDDCLDTGIHTLCCYDLAALVQAILPLGLGTPNYDIRMKYMAPFGYINETHLIGRTMTNNPFYGSRDSNLNPICGVNDDDRSGFNNHMFLNINLDDGNGYRVFDATCGPQIGTDSLSGYIDRAIDSTTNLKHYDKGTISDVNDGIGVSHLISQPEVLPASFTSTNPETAAESLFGLMHSLYPQGTSPPTPNVTVKDGVVWATWFIDVAGEVLKLDITCYDNHEGAKQLYNRTRAEKFPFPWTDESREPPKGAGAIWNSGDVDHNLRMVSIGEAGFVMWVQKNYLVTLKGPTIKGIENYVKGIHGYLAKLKDPEPPQITYDKASNKPTKVPDTFDIVLRGFTSSHPIPCNVEIQNGKALFLSSKPEGDMVTFSFLARFRGDEIITFTVFNSNMHALSHTVKFFIEE